MFRFRWAATLVVSGGLFALPAWALDGVTDAIQAAYPAYRAALFRTNTKSQSESEQALAQARQAWQSVIDRFGAKPPPPYDRDPMFAATLNEVAVVFEKASQQVRERQLASAHETLEAARELMAQLRRRNGIVVFSDHMNAYHAEMEHLLSDGARALAEPQGFMIVMARLGALEYLARQLRAQAPASVAADPEFTVLLQGVDASLAAVRAALLSQDAAAAAKAISQVKGPYARMFLRFG